MFEQIIFVIRFWLITIGLAVALIPMFWLVNKIVYEAIYLYIMFRMRKTIKRFEDERKAAHEDE